MIALWTMVAAAQDLAEVDAVPWRPRPGGDAVATWVPERLHGWRAGAVVDHARGSLLLEYSDGSEAAVVRQLHTTWFAVERGLGPLVVGGTLPLHVWRAGDLDDPLALAAGDPSVEAAFAAPVGPLDLGVSTQLAIPTGAATRQLGQPGWSADLLGGASWAGDGLAVTGNLGLRVNPRIEHPSVTADDELLARGCVELELGPGALGGELVSVVGLTQAAGAATTEGLLSWGQPVGEWRVQGALGGGLLTAGIGAPTWRVLVRVSREAVE